MTYRVIKIAVLTLCVALGTYSNLFTIIAFLICCALIVFDKESLYVMLFLHPFSTIFNLSPTGMSLMTILIILYVIIDIIKYQRMDSYFFVIYVLFVLFALLLSINHLEFTRIIKFFTGFLFVYYALEDAKRLEIKEILLHFILGMIVSSALAYFDVLHNLSAYFPEQNTLGYAFGYATRFSGLHADPNYYSVNTTICLCFLVFLSVNQMMKTPTQLLLAAPLIVFCFLTLSKSAVLSLAIVLLVLILYYFKTGAYKKAIGMIGLSAVGIVLLFSLDIPAVTTILTRFQTSDDLNSLTTGRFDLWKMYLHYITTDLKVFFFGRGICADFLSKAVHNTYLDCWYYLGIVGSFLLVCLCVVLNKNTTNGKKNIINFSVFLCILVMYFALSELLYFDFPIHLLLGSLIYRAPMHPQKDENRIHQKAV